MRARGVYAVAAAGLVVAGLALGAVWLARPAHPRLDEPLAQVARYCTDCHNDAELAGGVSFEHLRADGARSDAGTWERMLRKLRAGAMPPHDGTPRPAQEQIDRLTAGIETALDAAFAAEPETQSPLIHRLNGTEYSNAIRDLLGVAIDASKHLPPDGVVEGFDNIAEALGVSPALLEGYLAASAEVAALAVGDPKARPESVTYRTKPDQSQHEHVVGAPLGTIGGLAVEHYFPVDGTYRFEPRLYRQILASIRGLEFPNALEVTIDKVRVHYAEFGGLDDQKRSNEDNAYAVADEIDARLAFEAPVAAGAHKVAVAFIRKPPVQSADLWKPYRRQLIDSNEDKGLPHLDQVDITGPLTVTGVGDTPSRRRIFSCTPRSAADEEFCAAEVLSSLARRAYRRPVTEEEIAGLMTIYSHARARGTFDDGIKTAIRRIISGAEFVFRAERHPPGVAPGETYPVTDLELASRLSFFLWSSIPDDELLELASNQKLSDPRVLEAQARRMLSNEKSAALVSNFAGQWLTLRNLDGIVPDPASFPDFDHNLRQALARETELLFDSIVREDRSILDILDADYTFVNERLARHYGIPGVYGEQFRRVPVADSARRGILGQGSFLTLTSVATRTSPVTRGKWILDNLLGLPPPAPPSSVPPLESSASAELHTLREQMTRHRQDPVCATCHQIMDPFGFALENFDAVGRWRTTDGGAAIDASDTMFDGTEVHGAAELREFLRSKRELVVENVIAKLAIYALGRSLEPADMPTVRKIMRDTSADDHRFTSLVVALVESPAFRMRTAGPELSTGPAASVRQRAIQRPSASYAAVDTNSSQPEQ
jgi:hypothetical protein